MSIVTFYSYKGGVGRSLALANVAVLLARRRHRVPVIDWDLEAPGLEEYFTNFKIDADGRGLLFLLRDRGDLKSHIWRLTGLDDDVSLDFLPSGRDEPDYYPALETFDPDEFFASGGGDFLEEMRSEWEARYDFVLIDSRTGLSDTGGICTILLPDIIVALFTATRQSFRGVRDVLTLAGRARQKLAYTRPVASILPVPCRLDPTHGTDVQRWIDEFAEAMAPLTEDWRPRSLDLRDALNALRVDHVPDLSQDTQIVMEDAAAMAPALQAYDRLATLLQSDLTDMSVFDPDQHAQASRQEDFWADADFAGPLAVASAPSSRPSASGSLFSLLGRMTGETKAFATGLAGSAATSPRASQDNGPRVRRYYYDIYASVTGGSFEARWVENTFLPVFRQAVDIHLGREIRVFFPELEISAGEQWDKATVSALEGSRALMPFLSARAARSEFARREWDAFLDHDLVRPIFPVRLGNLEEPTPLNRYKMIDFSQYFTTLDAPRFLDTELGFEFLQKVEHFAHDVAEQLERE